MKIRAVLGLVVVALGLAFALSDARVDTWLALLPMFEWMETTPFG